MKLIKLSLVAALATSVTFATEFKDDIGVSANLAMTSNYLWRGATQTDNTMATQGGFDLDYKGVYVGVWGSNVSFAKYLELDLYAGYSAKVSNFSYDVGFIQYAYPDAVDANNFGEVYVGLGYDFEAVALSAKYSHGIKTNDVTVQNYAEVAIGVQLPAEFVVSAHYGLYTNIGSDYLVSVSRSLGKIDFDLSYVGFVADSDTAFKDQDNIVFTVALSF